MDSSPPFSHSLLQILDNLERSPAYPDSAAERQQFPVVYTPRSERGPVAGDASVAACSPVGAAALPAVGADVSAAVQLLEPVQDSTGILVDERLVSPIMGPLSRRLGHRGKMAQIRKQLEEGTLVPRRSERSTKGMPPKRD